MLTKKERMYSLLTSLAFTSALMTGVAQAAVGNLKGQAFLQTSSGTPRTCAGQDDILLVRAGTIDGAVEARFGALDRGFIPAQQAPYFPASTQPILRATCTASGEFQLQGLAPGKYFVFSTIRWGADQGGQLMREVEVISGQDAEIILSHTVEDVTAKVEPSRDPREMVAESAVKQRLIDPSSAQFEWTGRWATNVDYKFTRFSSSVHGDVTCGRVNARNRMGGYTGSAYFVVVVDNSVVKLLYMETPSEEIDMVRIACQKNGF